MDNNRVSVIIPTYNRADFITKSLDSVWEQTYRPIEVLVVDDGSTDNTQEIVEEWKKNHEDTTFTTKYIYQKNGGAPTARNTGIEHSTGRYLQFLDSDDLLMPEKLTLQIDVMKREKTPLCISDYLRVNDKGEVLMKMSKDLTINEIIKGFQAVIVSAPLIDRLFYKDDILWWNENIIKLQDKDYFIKILMVINDMSYVDKYLFKWVWHSEDRIENIKSGRKVKWAILKSVIIFHAKHFWSISYKKAMPIIKLYVGLLRGSLGIGTFLRSLKFWNGNISTKLF